MARRGLGVASLGLLFGGVWLGGGEISMWVPHVCIFFCFKYNVTIPLRIILVDL